MTFFPKFLTKIYPFETKKICNVIFWIVSFPKKHPFSGIQSPLMYNWCANLIFTLWLWLRSHSQDILKSHNFDLTLKLIFVIWILTFDIWHLTFEILHLRLNIWYWTFGFCLITFDIWHLYDLTWYSSMILTQSQFIFTDGFWGYLQSKKKSHSLTEQYRL